MNPPPSPDTPAAAPELPAESRVRGRGRRRRGRGTGRGREDAVQRPDPTPCTPAREEAGPERILQEEEGDGGRLPQPKMLLELGTQASAAGSPPGLFSRASTVMRDLCH